MDKQIAKIKKGAKKEVKALGKLEKADKRRDSLVKKGKKCPSAGHIPKRKSK